MSHIFQVRLGGACLNPAMTEFSDFISKQELMDLPFAGGTFTWSNSYSRSRIDRFLVSLEWKSNILACCKRGCLDCVRIIFPSCLIVMA